MQGWPFVAPLYNGKIMVFENAAASGDIDGDGHLELFSAARAQYCGGCETQLYAWREDGSVVPDWPKDDQVDGIKLSNTASSQNTPVLVDLDVDGSDEVLAGLGRVFAFDDVGSVTFPVAPISSDTQPSFADVDGDGRLELSGNYYNVIAIMDDDGASYWQRSMPVGGARSTLGVLADLDTDLDSEGGVELIVAYADTSNNISLFVWSIPGAGGDLEWPMFNGNSARSGRWMARGVEPPTTDTVAPTCAVTAPQASAILSGTVTVHVNASDNMGVSTVRLYRDGNLIGVSDAAPFEWPWDTRTASDGEYLLHAEALDAAGNQGTSQAVRVTVSNDPPPAEPVAAPSDLTADAAGTAVILTWTDNADNETGFRVERGVKVRGEMIYTVVGTPDQSDATSVAFTDTVDVEGNY